MIVVRLENKKIRMLVNNGHRGSPSDIGWSPSSAPCSAWTRSGYRRYHPGIPPQARQILATQRALHPPGCKRCKYRRRSGSRQLRAMALLTGVSVGSTLTAGADTGGALGGVLRITKAGSSANSSTYWPFHRSESTPFNRVQRLMDHFVKKRRGTAGRVGAPWLDHPFTRAGYRSMYFLEIASSGGQGTPCLHQYPMTDLHRSLA